MVRFLCGHCRVPRHRHCHEQDPLEGRTQKPQAASVHHHPDRAFEPVLRTGGTHRAVLDLQDHKIRHSERHLYGAAHLSACCRNIYVNLHDLADRPDGRAGKPAVAAQKAACAGTRAFHDDVHRPSLYSHAHRGDGQDHVGAEGQRRGF